MPLLRIHDCRNLQHWDDKTPEEIADDWFEKFEDHRPSLYEANNPFEEAEAVAAFSLPNSGKPRSYHIMRIFWEDLKIAGITANWETPGNTGVLSVDFRHYEIPGDKNKLIDLVTLIHTKVTAGEDRLRWIGCKMQIDLWKSFLNSPFSQVIKEAHRRCQFRIENKNLPKPRGPQIQKELQDAPPAIPDHRTRCHAFLKYLDRCRKNLPGNAEQDWDEAEKELRARYVHGILRYDSPP